MNTDKVGLVKMQLDPGFSIGSLILFISTLSCIGLILLKWNTEGEQDLED
jgi:hypothetical protein